MAPSIETLRQLAGRARKGDPFALGDLQENLHPGLVLVIRHALRTGRGGTALQHWIGRALESLPETDDADPSDTLARMLCDGLARPMYGKERGAISSAETVVESVN